MIYIALYLIAIVTANWSVAVFGPEVSIFNAFVFIGFNLVARDKLHNAWQHRNLKRNMFLLIASGSVLSLAFNAGQIAIASFIAFAITETIDAIVYHRLGNYPPWLRINGSNLPSALVDSVVFLILAFGWPPLWGIVLGQFLAKVGGGFIWSIMLTIPVKLEEKV